MEVLTNYFELFGQRLCQCHDKPVNCNVLWLLWSANWSWIIGYVSIAVYTTRTISQSIRLGSAGLQCGTYYAQSQNFVKRKSVLQHLNNSKMQGWRRWSIGLLCDIDVTVQNGVFDSFSPNSESIKITIFRSFYLLNNLLSLISRQNYYFLLVISRPWILNSLSLINRVPLNGIQHILHIIQVEVSYPSTPEFIVNIDGPLLEMGILNQSLRNSLQKKPIVSGASTESRLNTLFIFSNNQISRRIKAEACSYIDILSHKHFIIHKINEWWCCLLRREHTNEGHPVLVFQPNYSIRPTGMKYHNWNNICSIKG